MDVKLVKKFLDLHPRINEKWIEYGTAGFRTKSQLLDHVMFRVGILSVIRSKLLKKMVGLMITASHNEENDNGIKLVDPDGEMLEPEWETIATKLANVNDQDLIEMLQDLITSLKVDLTEPGRVVLGRDNRKSSPAFLKSAIEGVKIFNGEIYDFNMITTPQLHYLTVCFNTNGNYGDSNIDGYYSKLANAFLNMRKMNNGKKDSYYSKQVYLDAANGVGANAAERFASILKNELKLEIFNDGNGILNHQCGADYVKINQKPPLNSPDNSMLRCISIDGDADRIVYYYLDETKHFHLLDGDKIATLIATYLKELIDLSKLNIKLGLVQTAYANGASTKYVDNHLKIPIACTNTGVKFLHNEAKKFDIGIYFEANGHGTVLFKQKSVEMIRAAAESLNDMEEQKKAAFKLSNLIDIVNQTVGDALSDMLLVETILYEKGWDIITWNKCYNDLPNRQLKIKIKDRNLIKTTDAERKCIFPKYLQIKIDEIVANYKQGRAFIRPSGTEDIVRIYAECQEPDLVDKLASEVSAVTFELAGGIY